MVAKEINEKCTVARGGGGGGGVTCDSNSSTDAGGHEKLSKSV